MVSSCGDWVMGDIFSVDIDFNGKEYSFVARLEAVGYTHKFYIVVNGIEVIYEPDEERNNRAIVGVSDHSAIKGDDFELIKAIGARIQLIR